MAVAEAALAGDEEKSPLSYPPPINMWAYFALIAVCVIAWRAGFWYVTVACWFLMAHLGHAVLLSFHEAVHFTLSRNRFMNEVRGFVIGSSVGVPLSVYRQLHKHHHARLSSEIDAELWPYNSPSTSLWFRRMCAAIELTFGFFFTPLVFLRGTLVDKQITRPLAIRIAIEYGLVIGLWAGILTLMQVMGWWEYFIIGYLIPAMGAANFQSMRKFTEHMGLVGDSPLTLTRTVVDPTPVGRVISASMLHVSYHGTHHRYGKLAYYELPPATKKAYTTEPNPIPIYPTYWAAFWAMVPTLVDPKCGHQWVTDGAAKGKKKRKEQAEVVAEPDPEPATAIPAAAMASEER